MSRGQTEALGFLTAATGLLLLIAAAGNDCWRQGAKDPFTSVGLSSRCRGLWGECVQDSLNGVRTCDVTLSYLEHLPADILAMRAALVGMSLLSLTSILVMVPGLSCTELVPGSLDRDRLTWLSGVLSLCGGVCGAAGLMWYGVETYTRYRQEVAFGMPGVTYEFGLSYWLAVGGVFCSLTSAIAMIGNASPKCDVIKMHPAPQRTSHLNQTPNMMSTLNMKTYI